VAGCQPHVLIGRRARITPAPRVQAVQVDEDPSPFFEPLLRSFLLGLGAGALFEALHVCMKVRAVPAPAAPCGSWRGRCARCSP